MTRKSIRPAVIREQPSVRLWKGVLKGEPAFILGNGCSIADEDMSLIRDHFTIGINRAFYLLDPVVLFWQDMSLWDDEKAEVQRRTAVKVCRDIADPQHRFYNYRLRAVEGFRLPDSPHILYGSGATGPLAVQFAYSLGCDPIVLLGFDCKYRNAKTDFYGVNRHHKPHTLKNCVRGLKWINSIVTERTIINCSDNDIFEGRRTLAEVAAVYPPKGRDHYTSVLTNSFHY